MINRQNGMTDVSKRTDHSRISPTAKLAAYWRSLSDIPYSKEIAESVGAKETAIYLLGDQVVAMGTISPAMFEARYKSINRGLDKCGIGNALELACGLSPRGIEIVANGGTYVGTDLPDIYAESSPIIASIARRAGIPMDRFHLQPANVLDRDQMENAASYFRRDRFAVCNEGLMMYLDPEEKAKMAEIVRVLLLKSGGAWITTDITLGETRKKIASMLGPAGKAIAKSAMKKIADQTGRNITENDFNSKADAVLFYSKLGFDVEEFPMYDDRQTLPTASLMPEKRREELLEILSSAKTWILKPRN